MTEKVFKLSCVLLAVFCLAYRSSAGPIEDRVCTGTGTTCQDQDVNAECKTDATTCTCKDGYKVNSAYTDACIKVLLSFCTQASECSTVENSYCDTVLTNKCQCSEDYEEVSDVCAKRVSTSVQKTMLAVDSDKEVGADYADTEEESEELEDVFYY